MRNAFADEILSLSRHDPRVVLLSADIGNRLFDKLKAEFPDRFYNCGVAEANMIGVAAGLAQSGLRPFCYTITPFITYRCMEQIRVDLCYHHLPVTVVGTGSGLSYASLGGTHHSCEEMGMLRLLPGLTVGGPADAPELRALLRDSLNQNGPVYLRIGKKGEPQMHSEVPALKFGQSVILREGTEACILSIGTVLPVAMAAAEKLASSGISTRVVTFPTLKPLDEKCLQEAFSSFKVVATLEEHSILGGLGGSVAEWKADHPELNARLVRLGTPDEFLHLTCEQEEAREHYGLTAEGVAGRIETLLRPA
ncbi:MAG: transketolase [Verrucomicrobia bacterium]|nr:transketolase [Verrucomicrobiota bacterium]